MNFLKHLLQISLTVCLVVFLACYAVLQVVGSGLALNAIVKKTGVYDATATQVRDSLKQSSRMPAEYQVQFSSAVDAAITPEQLETIIQPALVDIATWLSQPGGTEMPDIILVIRPAKDKLIEHMTASGLPANETQLMQAQLSSQIPDQIQLSKLNSLVQGTDPAASTNNSAPESNDVKAGLSLLKQSINQVNVIKLISLIVASFSLAGLLWLGRTDGRKWVRRPAWSMLIAGSFFLIASLILPLFVSQPGASPVPANNISLGVVALILSNILGAGLLPAILLIIIGIGLWCGGFFIHPHATNTINQLPYRKV